MSGAASSTTTINAFWHRFLPSSLRTKLDGRHGLQAILGNSGWLMADKLFRMGMGVAVGIWVTRYLGPAQFGQLAFSWAFAGLVGAFATLGIDNIVVRELVREPEARDRILGSAFVLRFIGGIFALAISLVAISLLRPGDTKTFVLIAIATGGYAFQAFNVIDFYFQSRVQSRYTVLCATAAFIGSTIGRVILVLIDAPLVWFAFAAMVEIICTSLFLLVPYAKQRLSAFHWEFDGAFAKRLIRESWPITLALMANLLYMRLDQIMIGQMLNETEVGLFAASVKLTEIWYFVPMALLSSVFPSLLAAKKSNENLYTQRIQLLYDAMCWLGIFVAFMASVFSHWAVPLMYGKAFARAADVLTIQVWAGVAVAMGCVFGNWLIIEGLQKYFLYYTIFALLINITCNLFLIPRIGIEGAAIATLLAQFSPIILQLAFRQTRRSTLMMLGALLAPIRLARGRL